MACRYLVLVIFFLLVTTLVAAQEGSGAGDPFSLSEEQAKKPLTIDLAGEDESEEEGEVKKKKRKKNVFYGIKTRKFFVRTGAGERTMFESFHYLKEYEQPDPFVRDIYWFDFESRKIKKNRNINRKNGVILHGPYEKYTLDGTILETGIFYKGTKHGRWTRYDKKNILLDKKKYYKGWPKESIVSYYDKDRKKLKEIIPVEYGKKEGNYFYFHDNGMVAVSGEFQNDEQVKVWREYYKFRRRKKKEVQFKPDPWDEDFHSHIIKEWNEKGELIYDRQDYQRKVN